MMVEESAPDTLSTNEIADLRTLVRDEFPVHMFAVRVNEAHQSWVVLEPPAARVDLMRITICRISPAIMVMIEDRCGRRQILSAAGFDEALACARRAVDAVGAAMIHVHPVHAVRQ